MNGLVVDPDLRFWLADTLWTLSAVQHALCSDGTVEIREEDDAFYYDHDLIDALTGAYRLAFAGRAVEGVRRSLEEACLGLELPKHPPTPRQAR